MNFRDVELLSAYLDGRLKPSEATRLEARLSADPNLKATLEDLRETRGLLRRLPQRRAPRNFRLTPKMAGVRPPEPRSYPAFRFASALAAFLFVAAVALNAVTPFAARHLAPAAAPAYGLGGGGGSGGGGPIGGGDGTVTAPFAAAPAGTQAPPPTEEPTLQAFTTIMSTPTPEGTLSPAQGDTARTSVANAATEAASKAAPMASAVRAPEDQAPVPLPWVLGLGVLMLVFAVVAWILRRNNERRVRGEWTQK